MLFFSLPSLVFHLFICILYSYAEDISKGSPVSNAELESGKPKEVNVEDSDQLTSADLQRMVSFNGNELSSLTSKCFGEKCYTIRCIGRLRCEVMTHSGDNSDLVDVNQSQNLESGQPVSLNERGLEGQTFGLLRKFLPEFAIVKGVQPTYQTVLTTATQPVVVTPPLYSSQVYTSPPTQIYLSPTTAPAVYMASPTPSPPPPVYFAPPTLPPFFFPPHVHHPAPTAAPTTTSTTSTTTAATTQYIFPPVIYPPVNNPTQSPGTTISLGPSDSGTTIIINADGSTTSSTTTTTTTATTTTTTTTATTTTTTTTATTTTTTTAATTTATTAAPGP